MLFLSSKRKKKYKKGRERAQFPVQPRFFFGIFALGVKAEESTSPLQK